MRRASSWTRPQRGAERVERAAECGPVAAPHRLAHDLVQTVGARAKITWWRLVRAHRQRGAECGRQGGTDAQGVADQRLHTKQSGTSTGPPLKDCLYIQRLLGNRHGAERR